MRSIRRLVAEARLALDEATPAFAAHANRAKTEIQQIPPEEVRKKVGKVPIIDIREPSEWEGGTVPGAILLPRGILERDIEQHVPDMNTPIIIYCAKGFRSALSALSLKQMGYKNVKAMEGGYEAWEKAKP